MKTKEFLKTFYFKILNLSLNSSAREHGLVKIRDDLIKALPNINDQYTSVDIDDDYKINNLRTLHAFQIKIAKRAISFLDNVLCPTIVDIGDSSGVHLQYLQNIYQRNKLRVLSVNIDPEAVKNSCKGFECNLFSR